MSTTARIDRDTVLDLLAGYRERPAAETTEQIDSIELAWLIHQVEQLHQVELDLDDDQLQRMSEAAGAAEVLNEVLAGSADA
ncbi:hypothetical protein [Kitasatospora viridis]|uniref:Acyl carrier protein n=1 Tax=Kitasatospora viridis TaxID=281105 RepID=A0A561UIR3_9ACTN|nr:hypothetical protein [Kitasatospora viridis]TWF99263.1 hypothetical protein FHX73_113106 [Kitasatospora viridis]